LPWIVIVCFIITKFMGHDLAIIVMWNLLFISLYEINTNVIYVLVLFEHQCCIHCLNTNIICMFILFILKCCVSIHIVYIQKSCTQLLCEKNAWHSCVNDTNPWNNKIRINLERTHETYKFVMILQIPFMLLLLALMMLLCPPFMLLELVPHLYWIL
jgi:hypothetical protein